MKMLLAGAFLIGVVAEKQMLGFVFNRFSPAGVVVIGGLLVILGSFLMNRKKEVID